MGTDFEYRCGNGHQVGSAKPLDVCPVLRHGAECDGRLHAVGSGSQAENARLEGRTLVGASR